MGGLNHDSYGLGLVSAPSLSPVSRSPLLVYFGLCGLLGDFRQLGLEIRGEVRPSSVLLDEDVGLVARPGGPKAPGTKGAPHPL
jgi:hypothetical protein